MTTIDPNSELESLFLIELKEKIHGEIVTRSQLWLFAFRYRELLGGF